MFRRKLDIKSGSASLNPQKQRGIGGKTRKGGKNKRKRNLFEEQMKKGDI